MFIELELGFQAVECLGSDVLTVFGNGDSSWTTISFVGRALFVWVEMNAEYIELKKKKESIQIIQLHPVNL